MFKKVLPLLSLCFLFLSCSNNIFENVLFRSYSDPFDDKPVVNSFKTPNTIYISWQEDPGADEYILRRAYDAINPAFDAKNDEDIVYRGSDLNFVDTQVSIYSLYIYRLDKRRGSKTFKGTLYSGGVALDVSEDDYEFNNDINHTTFLDNTLSCNLPCVKYAFAELDEDERNYNDIDYFCVSIPGKRIATLNVNQTGFTGNGVEMAWALGDNGPSDVLEQNGNFSIQNNDNITHVIPFKIYPKNLDNVLSGMTSARVIHYKIELVSISREISK